MAAVEVKRPVPVPAPKAFIIPNLPSGVNRKHALDHKYVDAYAGQVCDSREAWRTVEARWQDDEIQNVLRYYPRSRFESLMVRLIEAHNELLTTTPISSEEVVKHYKCAREELLYADMAFAWIADHSIASIRAKYVAFEALTPWLTLSTLAAKIGEGYPGEEASGVEKRAALLAKHAAFVRALGAIVDTTREIFDLVEFVIDTLKTL